MTMKIIAYSIVLIIALLGYCYFSQAKGPLSLKVGQAAPDFNLPNTKGEMMNLAQFKGQWLVLYFYPKDDTPGCTKEACQFRDDMHKLEQLGTKVVGISVDDRQSHAEFSQKYALPFPLLSDTDGAVAARYQALTTLGPIKVAKRYTYLIDPQGQLAQIYLSVNTSKHSQKIIDDLTKLQSR